MGFIADTLFGSGPESKQQNLLTPEQSDLFVSLGNILNTNIGKGVEPYPGTYTPGPSTTQAQIFDLVNQLLGGQGPMQQQSTGVLGGLMDLMDPAKAKDYWEKGIKGPMTESWQKDIVPQILEQFAAYDAAGSGPARTAVAESGRRLETDMGSMLENLLQQFRGEAYGAAQTGLSYPETLIGSVLPAATTQRQITAEQQYEPYQDWLMSQPWANPWLQYMMPYLGQRTFENVVMPGQQGIFGDLLGAGAELGKAWIRSKSPVPTFPLA
jgi:hypothetical protein